MTTIRVPVSINCVYIDAYATLLDSFVASAVCIGLYRRFLGLSDSGNLGG